MTFSERGERLRGRERERREHSEEILFDLLYSIVQCSAVHYCTVQYCTLYGAF
jgi:hypothetical protein